MRGIKRLQIGEENFNGPGIRNDVVHGDEEQVLRIASSQ